MFCKNCGEQISDQAFVCPKCGVKVENTPTHPTEQDAPSTGFAILGFFLPLIGFILWLVWKDKLPLKAKSCGKGALIGLIVSIAFSVIYAIVVGAALGSMIYY